jgi:hypothetical protein
MRARSQLLLTIASVVLMLFVGSHATFALTLHEVPGAVRVTIEKEAKGGKVGAISREGEGKSATYSTVVETGGKSYDIVVGDHGKLLSKKLVGEKLNVKEKAKTEKDGKKSEGGKKGSTGGKGGSDSNSQSGAGGKSK